MLRTTTSSATSRIREFETDRAARDRKRQRNAPAPRCPIEDDELSHPLWRMVVAKEDRPRGWA
jgi:hypothetical protein